MLHQISATGITFVGEQDGPPERRLKEAISVLLDLNATVARAYLTQVIYNGFISGVMLGLLTNDKKVSEQLALQMDRAFGALLNTTAHLDVVFLDDESDAKIRKICVPFYDKRAGYH